MFLSSFLVGFNAVGCVGIFMITTYLWVGSFASCRIVRLFWSGLSPNLLLSFAGGGWGWGSGPARLSDLRGLLQLMIRFFGLSDLGLILAIGLPAFSFNSPSFVILCCQSGSPLRHFLCLLGLNTLLLLVFLIQGLSALPFKEVTLTLRKPAACSGCEEAWASLLDSDLTVFGSCVS